MKKPLLIVFAGLLLLQCSEEKKPIDDKAQKVEVFAQKVEDGLNSGKVGVLDLHFDKAAFVKRVTNEPYWNDRLQELNNQNYKPDYEKQLLQEISLGGMFLSGVDSRSYFSYDAVKTYQIDDRWHAVFRMYANDALNYHDYILRLDSNKVWIEDVYVMTVGKRLSQIMQESYISGIPSANSEIRVKDQEQLIRAKQLMNGGQFEDALAALDLISSDYQKQKSIRLFKLQILGNIASEEYVRELERYEQDFPNDVGTILLQMDKNFLYGNYPEALKNIQRLEKMYGHDAILDYLRGNAQNLLGNCDVAGVEYRAVLNEKTNWQMPLVNWLNCLIKAGKYTEAVSLIEEFQENYNLTPTYVKYLFTEQKNFLISTPFQNWVNAQT